MSPRAAGLPDVPARTRSLDDAVHDAVEIFDDLVLSDAENVPAELTEHAIAARVSARAALIVRCAVHLNDETDLGAREVHNVISDDELTTERKAGSRA
jgi:hypothetical protein